ncbi:MAG: type II toxin-antitoxin system RelE/ParE family toxin [Flavobacteriales bacterium]|nr:type II toxin-antitoxin system RelE/ParE family toxin [Flavobacteriales bacterium]MBP9079575.1 type II toxin-antitoxin system RelE/ParE family toxin [Flavobacteriales bacterium]
MKRRSVVVQSEAQEEVEAIRSYQYELDPERALRFIEAFNDCLEDLGSYPAYQKRKGHYRHVMLRKLPYRVVVEVEEDTVYIYQVRHTSRKPSRKFGP